MRILRWLAAALLLWGVFVGFGCLMVPLVSEEGGSVGSYLLGVGLVGFCGWGITRLFSVRWLANALLLWGLFTGIAYVLAPLVADVEANLAITLVGIGLIVLCDWGLLRVNRHRRELAGQPE